MTLRFHFISFLYTYTGNLDFRGAVASAILFAIALVVCVAAFTIAIVIFQNREKLKGKITSLQLMRRTTKESNSYYEDVGIRQPRASTANSTNLTKNIAYDQPSIAGTHDMKQCQ